MQSAQASDRDTLRILASQGDPEAIATLLNHEIHFPNINIRVGWKDGDLGILLESETVPHPDPILAWLHQQLAQLQIESATLVRVYSRQIGQSIPSWRREIEFVSAQPSAFNTFSLIHWLSQGKTQDLPSPEAPQSTHYPDEIRLLRFYVNSRDTALLSLSCIREVFHVNPKQILPVPNLPDCVLGVCNYRGEMLWVVDLGQQLGCSTTTLLSTVLTTIPTMVVTTHGKSLGLAVSQVVDIETHSQSEIYPTDYEVFPRKLASYLEGCLVPSSSPILNLLTLVDDPQFQMYSR